MLTIVWLGTNIYFIPRKTGFRANARAKNLGWRIDYTMATSPLEPHIRRAAILPEARHSDHCPVLLELAF